MASNIVTKAGDVLVTKSGDSLEYLNFVNKVVYGGNTIIDISDTSATASDVALGKKFYMANGAPAVGTATSVDVGLEDGDNLAYGASLVGSAIVGSAVIL